MASVEVQIRSQPRPNCFLCERPGVVLYADMQDRLFGAPGAWTLKRCPSHECGLAWLDPMPIDEDIPNAYKSYYTHPEAQAERVTFPFKIYRALRAGYLETRRSDRAPGRTRWLAPLIWLNPGWRAEADFSVMHQASPFPGMRLLDLGCGDGSALERLRDLGWKELWGLDLDPIAVQRARQKGLNVQHGTLKSQAYPDGFYDVITMSHVVEHVPDPTELLHECRRVLKPRGRLVVYTPNLDSLGHQLFRGNWLPLDPPRHLHLFNRTTLAETVARSGHWEIRTLRTTVRGASVILVASADIRTQGRATMGRRRNGRERVLASAFLYAEAALAKARPVGEELVLVAEKAG